MEINPFLAAIKEKEFSNSVVQSEFNNFKDLLRETSNIVDFNMQFFLDNNKSKVKGNIKTKVILNCNRCLNALNKDLELSFDMFLLRSEAHMQNLPKNSDFLIIEDDKVSILDIVEEELILALPLVVRHDFNSKECISSHNNYAEVEQNTENLKKVAAATTKTLLNNSKLAELKAAFSK